MGLGDSEFGLGMELVNPDKESVEKRRGDWKPERERVDFPCNLRKRLRVREESRSVSYNHFAGSDNPQSLGLGSASAKSGQEI